MKVLVAPLNWGVGHATRCIPMIRFLLNRGDEVHIASDGESLNLLRCYFPHLTWHELPQLEIRYNRYFPLFFAFPRLSVTLVVHFFKDRKAIGRLMQEEHFDCIFSDNRYGIRSPEAKSYLVTHQLRVYFGSRWAWIERLSCWIIKKLVTPFNTCLVPDYDSNNNLAGRISKSIEGVKVLYTGPQSRFPLDEIDIPLPRYDLVVIISGPEPQRAAFEKLVTSLATSSSKRIMIVRGTKVAATTLPSLIFSTLDFASDLMLQTLIKNAKVIIARAGYSTIMDINAFGRGAILVPTPHQPEQEYLATWLDGKRGFVRATQTEESLKEYF